jgi:cytochrome P450
LLDTATEECLRFFTPAQGGGRTITQDCEVNGFSVAERDRMFLSYAMCNHDPASFPDPDEIVLDRFPNPHAAFGLGVHRCIGSNLARLDFKYMLREALRRMPDYRIDHAGKEQYESIGTINGFKHLPATFTPGRREGPSRAEVMADWQARLDAEPAPENLRVTEGA